MFVTILFRRLVVVPNANMVIFANQYKFGNLELFLFYLAILIFQYNSFNPTIAFKPVILFLRAYNLQKAGSLFKNEPKTVGTIFANVTPKKRKADAPFAEIPITIIAVNLSERRLYILIH